MIKEKGEDMEQELVESKETKVKVTMKKIERQTEKVMAVEETKKEAPKEIQNRIELTPSDILDLIESNNKRISEMITFFRQQFKI